MEGQNGKKDAWDRNKSLVACLWEMHIAQQSRGEGWEALASLEKKKRRVPHHLVHTLYSLYYFSYTTHTIIYVYMCYTWKARLKIAVVPQVLTNETQVLQTKKGLLVNWTWSKRGCALYDLYEATTTRDHRGIRPQRVLFCIDQCTHC